MTPLILDPNVFFLTYFPQLTLSRWKIHTKQSISQAFCGYGSTIIKVHTLLQLISVSTFAICETSVQMLMILFWILPTLENLVTVVLWMCDLTQSNSTPTEQHHPIPIDNAFFVNESVCEVSEWTHKNIPVSHTLHTNIIILLKHSTLPELQFQLKMLVTVEL